MPWYIYDDKTGTWSSTNTYVHNKPSRWFAEGTPAYLIYKELNKVSEYEKSNYARGYTSSQAGYSSVYSSESYKPYVPPPKPWEGVDKNRFPSTFAWLVMFFYQPTYHADTKYVNKE